MMIDLQTGVSLVALVGLFLMALFLLRCGVGYWGKERPELSRNRDGSFAHTCTICGDKTMVPTVSLVKLTPVEKALVVREHKQAVGKNLMEYVCRNCDASHCFIVAGSKITFLGVNPYEGQGFGSRCKECQKKLATPPWEPGYYDGRVAAAPGETDDLGLECRYCGAVSCTACCNDVTRKRTRDGSLLCPRCFRGPMDTFFAPE